MRYWWADWWATPPEWPSTTAEPDPATEISDATSSLIDTISDATPRVLVAVAVVVVGYGLSRALRWILRRTFMRKNTLSFANVMSKVSGWLLLAVVVLLAIAITFPSVQPVDLLAGLGFFSVAVGFAFQDILENTLSGILLLFRQPFRAGDQIEVLDQRGTVLGITIRETRIKAYDGELIIIPNRDVYKNVIVVNTHFEQRRGSFVVGVAYENDAAQAREVIGEALVGVEGVSPDPAPVALIQQLGVSTVDITAYYWTDPHRFDAIVTKDRAIVAVKRRLDAEGIEMPADIVALQATPSFRAAVQGDRAVTPGGSVIDVSPPTNSSSDAVVPAASTTTSSARHRRSESESE